MARALLLQWMRNKEAGQEFGNQEEILPLTEAVFRKEVLPRIRKSAGRTLAEYRAGMPFITHYSRVRKGGRGPWEFVGVGPAVLFVENQNAARYAKVVESWDSAEAREWGLTADSDVYGLER